MLYRRVFQLVVVAVFFALPAVVLAASDNGGQKVQLKNQYQHAQQYEKRHQYLNQNSDSGPGTDGVRLKTQKRTTSRTRTGTGNTK